MIGSEYETLSPAAEDEIDRLELKIFRREMVIAVLLAAIIALIAM